MKILKKGQTVVFVCDSCGCEFAIGINVADTPDKGENYYATCPTCGWECHTDGANIQAIGYTREKES